MDIFRRNETYVFDPQIIFVVTQIKEIVLAENPYTRIPELPSLCDAFSQHFMGLLESKSDPVRKFIELNRQTVRAELGSCRFREELVDKFESMFHGLLHRLEASNSLSEIIGMKGESDLVKLRCFNEIEVKRKQQGKAQTNVAMAQSSQTFKQPSKQIVNRSVMQLFQGASMIESDQDIEKLIDDIRVQLKQDLQANTVVRLV